MYPLVSVYEEVEATTELVLILSVTLSMILSTISSIVNQPKLLSYCMANRNSSSTSSDKIQISDPQFLFIWDHNIQELDFLNSIQVNSPFSSFDFEFIDSVDMSTDSIVAQSGTNLLTWEYSTKLSTSSVGCPKTV